MTLRVCHAVSSLARGGAENVVAALAVGETQRGLSVEVATVLGGGPLVDHLRDRRVPVTVFDVRRAPAREFARLVRFFHRRFDVVHTHPGTVARAAARIAGVPAIVSSWHNLYGSYGRAWRLSFAILSRATHGFIAVSRAVAEDGARVAALDVKRVHVVYNGVDLNRFCVPSPDARARARARLGVAADETAFGIVGRLDSVKRPERFVRALAELERDGVRAKGFLIGDGPARVELEREAAALSSPVRILGLRTDVPELLAGLDVLVHTAWREGFCLAAVEAMASGRPVVASDLGPLREVVGDEAGLLVPVDDSTALVEALQRLARDPALRAKLGAAGRRRAEALFDRERMVDETIRVYDEVLREHGRSRRR